MCRLWATSEDLHRPLRAPLHTLEEHRDLPHLLLAASSPRCNDYSAQNDDYKQPQLLNTSFSTSATIYKLLKHTCQQLAANCLLRAITYDLGIQQLATSYKLIATSYKLPTTSNDRLYNNYKTITATSHNVRYHLLAPS